MRERAVDIIRMLSFGVRKFSCLCLTLYEMLIPELIKKPFNISLQHFIETVWPSNLSHDTKTLSKTALVETGPDYKHVSRQTVHGWPKTTLHRDFTGLSRFDPCSVCSYLFIFHKGRILIPFHHHSLTAPSVLCLPSIPSLCWFSCVIFMRIKLLCSLSVRSCVV